MKVISIQSSDKGFEGGIKPNKMANLAYSAMLSLSLLSATNADVFTKSQQQEQNTEISQFNAGNKVQKSGWLAENIESVFFMGALAYLAFAFPAVFNKSRDNLTKE